VTATGTTAQDRALGALTESMQAFGRMVAQGRVIEAVLKRSRIELSRADLQVLHALQEAGGGGVRPGDLADRLLVDAPTITRRVQQLEARHLVRRAIDPLDRRAQLVQLTANGTRTIERALAAVHNWLESVLADWSGTERAQLAELLGRFTRDVYASVETHGH
jgi:DNA-binding MarR family transcriptional regulator